MGKVTVRGFKNLVYKESESEVAHSCVDSS